MGIVAFKASNFSGDCHVDSDFVPYLDKMNAVATKHNMIVIVTSSLRKDTNVKNAIVVPAKKSNHLIGYALDANLKNKITGEYYDSTKMGDGTGSDEIFCKAVVAETGLRWGQSFSKKDSVHFDYNLSAISPAKWEEKYKLLHSN